MPTTPLQIIYNLRRYIQYVIQQTYHDDRHYCPPLQHNWIKQTKKRFMKFVIYHSKDTLKCVPTPNGELIFLKKSLQKYLQTQPVVKTQLHIKTKCNLPNKSVQTYKKRYLNFLHLQFHMCNVMSNMIKVMKMLN